MAKSVHFFWITASRHIKQIAALSLRSISLDSLSSWLPLYLLLFFSLAAANERNVKDVRYVLENQRAEIMQIKERLENQESIIDLVRDCSDRLQVEFYSTMKSQATLVQESREEMKSDVETLQNYIRETGELFQERFSALECTVKQQAKTISSLENAVQSILDALADPSEQSYQVVEGDSLEKIAKRYHTTISQLKEVNRLSGDRILIGQKLKIPSSKDEK